MRTRDYIAGYLVFLLVFGLSACGGGSDKELPGTTDSFSDRSAAEIPIDVRVPDVAELVSEIQPDTGPADVPDIASDTTVPDVATCGDGTVLDPVSGKCVPAAANCLPGAPESILADCEAEHKECVEGTGEAHCGDCVDGFVEDEGTCQQKTCQPAVPASILLECEAAFRLCAESESEPAACGGCFAWYTEKGGLCVPVQTCQDLGCATAHKKCTPADLHADAECGTCVDGFVPKSGDCVPLAAATCAAGTAESIVELCSEAHRLCVEVEGAAHCGDCEAGYFDFGDTGICGPVVPCDQLDCETGNQVCLEVPAPHCGGCLDGFGVDKVTGECTASLTCEMLDCEGKGMSCVPAWGGEDAYCFPACPEGQALSGSQCIPCSNPCNGAGEKGVLWPVASQSGKCVCETEPGWFYTEGIDIGTYACDSDDDGWVTESARLSLSSKDPAIHTNARCNLLSIDRVVLQNEGGETRTVLLSVLLPSFTGDHLDLYEPDHLDNEALQKWAELPAHGARKLKANELNPLVRYCADADYNGNGFKDFEEWQNPEAKIPTNPFMAPFVAFATFSELFRTWYAPPQPGAAYGAWHVRERPRLDAEADDVVPILYDAVYEKAHGAPNEATAESMMKSCVLWPDPAFDPLADLPAVNQDFHRFAPHPPSNDFARIVEVEPGVTAVIPENHWDGMNLNSQFRCIQLVNTPPLQPQLEPNKLTLDQFSDQYSLQSGLRFQLNACGAVEGPSDSLPPPAELPNPFTPVIECKSVDVATVDGGEVGFAAVRYRADAPYIGGCINQCQASNGGCGLCGYGSWLNAGGVLCAGTGLEPGYAGIPGGCQDIAHPAGVDLFGVVCDECSWQADCDDASPCTINLCHKESTCLAPIPTPDGGTCADDDNPCTYDFCTAGKCSHPPKPYGTSCPGDGMPCKTWLCGGSTQPAVTFPGVCTWLPKPVSTKCPLDPPKECWEGKCMNNGTCGIPLPKGSACVLTDDGNACTAAQCDANGVCKDTFLGDAQVCTADTEQCTKDHCAMMSGKPGCLGDAVPMEGMACTPALYAATCNKSKCASGTCKADGDCPPGKKETCNICGSRTCGETCQWGTCTGWEAKKDDYELAGNETKQTASDLGTYNDDPAPAPFVVYGTLIPKSDVDWYKMTVNDTCCEEYPDVTISVVSQTVVPSPKLTVFAEWVCQGDAAKKQTLAETPVSFGIPVTKQFKGLDCPGGADDVYLYIQIKYSGSTSAYSCEQYSLSVTFS